MTDAVPGKAFVQRWTTDRPEILGARWWREGLRVAAEGRTRRSALKTMLTIGAGLAGAGLVLKLIESQFRARPPERPRELTPTQHALEAQRADGWNVGATGDPLAIPESTLRDVQGSLVEPSASDDLALRLQPPQERLRPFYVPTLFQAVAAVPGAASGAKPLRDALQPVHSAAMDDAFDRGEAVRTLFAMSTGAPDTAIVVDLPGPESVALAAALARDFAPVFAFDNWPHPRGVVPSHLTLGAVLYHLPDFREATRDPLAAPVFVLDRSRLNAYVDASDRFDNRYLARLPSAKSLQALAIRHVLYVCQGVIEADDLNDDFVGWNEGHVDVKILPLAELKQWDPQDPASRPASRPAGLPETAPAHGTGPAAPREPEIRDYYRGNRVRHFYHWGPSPWYHPWFWSSYGWRSRPTWSHPSAPMFMPSGPAYVPTPRLTPYSTGLPGGPAGGLKAKPDGFGRVSYRKPPEGAYGGSSGPRSGSTNRGTGYGGG